MIRAMLLCAATAALTMTLTILSNQRPMFSGLRLPLPQRASFHRVAMPPMVPMATWGHCSA